MTKHFSYKDRISLKEYLNEGYSARKIAVLLNKSTSTIYNELRRGKNEQGVYDPDIAQNRYDHFRSNKGSEPKLAVNSATAGKISKMLLEDGMSPESISKKLDESEYVSPGTIYTAIDKGLIPNVSRKKILANQKHRIYNDGNVRLPKYILKDISSGDGDTLTASVWDSNTIILQKEPCALPCAIGTDVYIVPSKTNFYLNVLNGLKINNRVYHQVVKEIVITENSWYMQSAPNVEYEIEKILLPQGLNETWFITEKDAHMQLVKLHEMWSKDYPDNHKNKEREPTSL